MNVRREPELFKGVSTYQEFPQVFVVGNDSIVNDDELCRGENSRSISDVRSHTRLRSHLGFIPLAASMSSFVRFGLFDTTGLEKNNMEDGTGRLLVLLASDHKQFADFLLKT